jgi:hypothetical protein
MATTEPNGNYLFELKAQPGGPIGWPDKKTGSKPIPINGRPQDERLTHTPSFMWVKLHLVPNPVETNNPHFAISSNPTCSTNAIKLLMRVRQVHTR